MFGVIYVHLRIFMNVAKWKRERYCKIKMYICIYVYMYIYIFVMFRHTLERVDRERSSGRCHLDDHPVDFFFYTGTWYIYLVYRCIYIYSYLVEGFPLGIVADFKARGVSRAEKGVHS